MYLFTDKQKAELFDAGVTINDVANYYATDDRCIESADEAFYTLIEWYGDHSLQGCGSKELDYEAEMEDRDEGRYLCTNNDIVDARGNLRELTGDTVFELPF